ncbi:MAG: RHS repeat-associated core domain-containing protein, partial [Candidatus Zixiibacteriota bacterium]
VYNIVVDDEKPGQPGTPVDRSETESSGGGSGDVVLEGQPGSGTTIVYKFLYYHLDHLGTPMAVTDGAKDVVWSSDYYPFGSLYDEQVVQSNELRFPGQYHDRESDLYYNWHRYYEPELGRYVTPDPLGLGAGDVNLYRYVYGNPANYSDPTGMQPFHPSEVDMEWPTSDSQDSEEKCEEPKCDRSWGWCYTRCIGTLAPGFEGFFIGSQLLSNVPYTVKPLIVSPNRVIFVEKPHVFAKLLPRTWGLAAKVSKVARPIQAVAFSWVAGSSYGCMLSCALDPCSY